MGVSTDKVEGQKKFHSAQSLPYDLIADPEAKIVDAFKVAKIAMGKLAAREAFLVKDGKIVWHDAKASTDKQAEDIKAALGGK